MSQEGIHPQERELLHTLREEAAEGIGDEHERPTVEDVGELEHDDDAGHRAAGEVHPSDLAAAAAEAQGPQEAAGPADPGASGRFLTEREVEVKDPAPKAADPVAAFVSLLSMQLCAAGVPAKLGMTTAEVVIYGGLVILVFALARMLIHLLHREKVSMQDVSAAIFGALGYIAGESGMVGADLNPDLVAGMGSSAVFAFATMRSIMERKGKGDAT